MLFYQAVEELLVADSDDRLSSTPERSTDHELVLDNDVEPDVELGPVDPDVEPGPSNPGMHDIGIQCCFEPLTLRSIEIQTEPSEQSLPSLVRTPLPRYQTCRAGKCSCRARACSATKEYCLRTCTN